MKEKRFFFLPHDVDICNCSLAPEPDDRVTNKLDGREWDWALEAFPCYVLQTCKSHAYMRVHRRSGAQRETSVELFSHSSAWSTYDAVSLGHALFCRDVRHLLLPPGHQRRQYLDYNFGKIIKTVATRCHILKLKCTKFDFGWSSAPDPSAV